MVIGWLVECVMLHQPASATMQPVECYEVVDGVLQGGWWKAWAIFKWLTLHKDFVIFFYLTTFLKPLSACNIRASECSPENASVQCLRPMSPSLCHPLWFLTLCPYVLHLLPGHLQYVPLKWVYSQPKGIQVKLTCFQLSSVLILAPSIWSSPSWQWREVR